jgi:N-methylhydantoinase B
VVRSIRVLEAATVSLLTDRRRHPPEGARGGRPGAVGRNLLGAGSGAGSDAEVLPAKTTRRLDAGEVVTVVTPGGGGWGSAP